MEAGTIKTGMRTGFGMAELLLLCVAIVWGTSYGVAKGALLFYPVLGFLAVRFLITFCLLMPALVRGGMANAREALSIGLPPGLLLLAIFICETFGVALTTASNAAFLISLCVVMTPFAEWAMLRVRPKRGDLLATAVSLLGAYLLTAGVELTFNAGDALILAAAVLRAVIVTLTKKRSEGKAIDSLSLTAVQTGTVAVGCVVLALVATPGGLPPLPADPAFWYATLYLVVFCTIFAFFVQTYAVRRSSPTRVSLLMGTEPVFGAVFASMWLGEKLGPMAWIGGALIVAAPLWTTFRRE